MKSVRVATLEVSEGEECGVPFFTLHKTQGGVLHTLFTVAIGASSYPGLGTERPRCPLSAHGSRPRCPVQSCEPIEDHPNEKRKRSQCSCLVVARPTLHQRTRPWNRPARGRSTVGGVVGASSTARPLMPTHECERPSLIKGSWAPRPPRGRRRGTCAVASARWSRGSVQCAPSPPTIRN